MINWFLVRYSCNLLNQTFSTIRISTGSVRSDYKSVASDVTQATLLKSLMVTIVTPLSWLFWYKWSNSLMSSSSTDKLDVIWFCALEDVSWSSFVWCRLTPDDRLLPKLPSLLLWLIKIRLLGRHCWLICAVIVGRGWKDVWVVDNDDDVNCIGELLLLLLW